METFEQVISAMDPAEVEAVRAFLDDDIDHILHPCDENRAICGLDVSHLTLCPDNCPDHIDCVLCVLAYEDDNWRCPGCGGNFLLEDDE